MTMQGPEWLCIFEGEAPRMKTTRISGWAWMNFNHYIKACWRLFLQKHRTKATLTSTCFFSKQETNVTRSKNKKTPFRERQRRKITNAGIAGSSFSPPTSQHFNFTKSQTLKPSLTKLETYGDDI
jgi:hypothetical protein